MAQTRRRWLRVSLRGLLAAVTLLCVSLGWWTYTAKRQAAAVRVIEGLGCTVRYETQPEDLAIPAQLLNALSVHYFTSVSDVRVGRRDTEPRSLAGERFDALVSAVRRLPRARSLHFNHSGISDSEIHRLQPLADQIESLEFIEHGSRSNLNGTGLADLHDWRRLSRMVVMCSVLNPDALSNLHTFSNLESLTLEGIHTLQHFKDIEKCRSIKKLGFVFPWFEDAGVSCLLTMPRLESILLQQSVQGPKLDPSTEAWSKLGEKGVEVNFIYTS